MYHISFIYYNKHTLYIGISMARVSINIDEQTLSSFDELWKREGWESRQEAIIFLMRKAVAQGVISQEKAELAKAVKGGENT
jgi:metal-responsive CopG/Arc/MetJ family transcriptional regulator